VFYASDGDNASSDHDAFSRLLSGIATEASYCGYLEVATLQTPDLSTETGGIFAELEHGGLPAGSFALGRVEDVWSAIRHFFSHEQRTAATAGAP
jgi:uncharacterized sporulation protein YeaH/YhbH (DUF444 family)